MLTVAANGWPLEFVGRWKELAEERSALSCSRSYLAFHWRYNNDNQ